jgi:hypothetical protein
MSQSHAVFKNAEKSSDHPIVLVTEDSIVPLIPDSDQGFPYVKGAEIRNSESSEGFLEHHSVLSVVPNVIEES